MDERDTGLSIGIPRQMAIYQEGMAGKLPEDPIAVRDVEEAARKALSPEAYDYVAGGAGTEDTVRANLDAFQRWRIVPRFLRDVGRRDLRVEIFGKRLPAPLMLAPIGVMSIIQEHGDLAVARAARTYGIPLIISTASSSTIEAVAAEMGDAPRWFQLYWPSSNDLATSFVQRAERAGYSAIVVTLDTYLLGWRERDIQNAYLPFLQGHGLANYLSDPVFLQEVGVDPRTDRRRTFETFARLFSDPSRTWADLARLREVTRLPIILKGVLHPDDARKAVDHGASGVIVSNHGGRQVNGAIAALDALPGVVEAAGDRLTVFFDSGIRSGADVVKALSLGARSVLIGRPYVYGLAAAGERGVASVLANLIADLDLTLGLMGCSTLGELGRGTLTEAPHSTP
jgi:isopentenyl diphosphate isomerase/L-lactate dehydrogenase-like FMN-dependent dehydrogenase